MRLTPLPALADNYIWLLSQTNGHTIIVDPGQAEPVFAAIAQGLTPVAVLLTHHHGDHIDGVQELLQRWPKLPIYAPDDPRIPWGQRVPPGEQITLMEQSFRVIATPGHTRSHIAYYTDGVVFCGDTLFSLGCGRLFEGTAAQLWASLQLLSSLPGTTQICCGHEYSQANATFARHVDPKNNALVARAKAITLACAHGQPTVPVMLAHEKQTNPFLRLDSPAIQSAVTGYLGQPPADSVATLAALRQWKDGFRPPNSL